MKRLLFALLAAAVPGVFLLGCAAQSAMTVAEHSSSASMQSALATVVYHPQADGSITAEPKTLPWESDMGSYALSFVLDDDGVSYRCRTEGATIHADIQRFPVFDDAAIEQAAVISVVNTLAALPGVEQVALTFDGERLAALKHGTPVNELFSAQALTTAFAPTPSPTPQG